jgi:hypothetical protein
MAKFLKIPEYTLRLEVEEVEVNTGLPQRDPNWTFTDEAGHEHHAAAFTHGVVYPTLEWIVDVEGDDEWPEIGHYVCKQGCGEAIEPGMIGPSPFRQFIAGETRAYLSVDGSCREIEIPFDEAKVITEADRIFRKYR